jgi:hypothetical protein
MTAKAGAKYLVAPTSSGGFKAGGDLAGTSTSQTVIGIQGRPVSSAAPSNGQVLEWNGSLWVPTTLAAGGVTSYNTRTGAVTSQLSDVVGLFTAKGQIFVGTGSGTGELFNNGSNVANSFLIIGGSDPSGFLWSQPLEAVGNVFTATGDLLIGLGANAGVILGIGTAGQVLEVVGGTAAWATPIWLPLAGGNMTGIIAMGANRITGLANGVNPQDAATLSQLTGYATSLGGDLSGSLPDPTVVGFQGRPFSSSAPGTTNIIEWNGSSWVPTTIFTPIYANLGSKGALIVGTGATTGEVLAGSSTAGQGLVVGGSDPSGLEWVAVLQAANNLSDVANAGTSRFNLAIPVPTSPAAVAVANVNIASPGATLDGYALVANDEILLTAQSTASQNGIWTWNASASALTRPNDFPSGGVIKRGRQVTIGNGTVYAGTIWQLTATNAGLTIDTSAQTWKQVPYSAVGSGVTSFNTRTGAVTLSAADVEALFTASGQLFVGTGSGTGTLLAAGASGTVLEGGTTPAWGVLPGTVLATQQFAPSTLSTYAAAATTMTALDTTNLTLSFTVPANGIVDVLVQITYTIVGTVGGATLYLCLLNHTGGALVGNVQVLAVNGGTSITLQAVNTVTFHLTGLTPGALQIDVAGGKIDPSGTATGNFYAIANTSKTIASDTPAGPCIIQAKASV